MPEIWFENAGARLFAVERGAGAPVILCHGGLANHEVWSRYAGLLFERARVITPDLRGSGRSHYAGPATDRSSRPQRSAPPSWDLYADDLAALVKQLELERVVIGGISAGAAAAMRFALRYPAFVAGLAIVHPAFGGADVGLTPIQQQAMDAMNAAGQRALVDGMRALDPLVMTLPEALRERARATLATYDPASVAATTAFLATGAQPFATASELAAITAPVLVVPGIDPQHPVAVAERIRDHLPRCTYVATTDIGAALADFVASI